MDTFAYVSEKSMTVFKCSNKLLIVPEWLLPGVAICPGGSRFVPAQF